MQIISKFFSNLNIEQKLSPNFLKLNINTDYLQFFVFKNCLSSCQNIVGQRIQIFRHRPSSRYCCYEKNAAGSKPILKLFMSSTENTHLSTKNN